MIIAYKRGVCVVAVYTRNVAKTKATRTIHLARSQAYPYCSRPDRKIAAAFPYGSWHVLLNHAYYGLQRLGRLLASEALT